MDHSSVPCPAWLIKRLDQAGGSISFHQYMEWSLNDPEHGAYATGQLKIGRHGDFTTSPSLGNDFAQLLALQLADWFEQLKQSVDKERTLSLLEFGPGEGDLSFDLISALEDICPALLPRLELILVEANQAMVKRQQKRLGSLTKVPIHWRTLEELAKAPVVGVMIAHEMLDALPVERLVLREQRLFRQGVCLESEDFESYLSFTELPLTAELTSSLADAQVCLGIQIPPADAADGWCSEWHCELKHWWQQASAAMSCGPLLVIDYALEARRYYNASRSAGTLMAYRQQSASGALLEDPGQWDLTAHLCLETLQLQAEQQGWTFLGEVRQGQALLALGLAEKLHALQALPSSQLDIALQRREALLRLVDPVGLGEFRWLAFELHQNLKGIAEPLRLRCRFLEDPIS